MGLDYDTKVSILAIPSLAYDTKVAITALTRQSSNYDTEVSIDARARISDDYDTVVYIDNGTTSVPTYPSTLPGPLLRGNNLQYGDNIIHSASEYLVTSKISKRGFDVIRLNFRVLCRLGYRK